MNAKQKRSNLLTLSLFALAVLLLVGSTVGSSRATLTYFSKTYAAEVSMYDIGITLMENGKDVSYRNFSKEDHEFAEVQNGKLLEHLNELKDPEGKDVPFKLGVPYEEKLTVRNSGTIDHYARVTIVRYWEQTLDNGTVIRRTDLDPDNIDLHLLTVNDGYDSGWFEDESASTKERKVLYYQKVLPTGETAPLFADWIRIDDVGVRRLVKTETTEENGKTVVKRVYDYNGVQFVLEVTADAVQTHNFEQAIKSAWGIDKDKMGIQDPPVAPGSVNDTTQDGDDTEGETGGNAGDTGNVGGIGDNGDTGTQGETGTDNGSGTQQG